MEERLVNGTKTSRADSSSENESVIGEIISPQDMITAAAAAVSNSEDNGPSKSKKKRERARR
jgi:hypothetical protein